MAEQTFKSPGFFEREIEIISRPISRTKATPVGVISTSKRGPAFVPTTVTSREEYIRIFGEPDPNRLGGHAAAEYFRNSTTNSALTFCRVLGSGLKSQENAGFKFTPRPDTTGGGVGRLIGASYFLASTHTVSDGEWLGLGSINDNDSFTTNMLDVGNVNNPDGDDKLVNIVRAMIITHKDYSIVPLSKSNDSFIVDADSLAVNQDKLFYIRFRDDAGQGGDSLDYVFSLDPGSDKYISKVLNTDPFALESKKHFLYAHFPIDAEVAEPAVGARYSLLQEKTDGFAGAFENFESRFKSATSPMFISQPFGSREYDLFYFDSLDDGAYANDKYKISISNLRASTDPTDEYGTFTVTVRDLKDTDESPIIYETFNQCSLDPNSSNFISRVIGDQKVYFNFDAASENERRLVREGTFKNNSQKVRVVVSDAIMQGEVPAKTLPFGFRGIDALHFNQNATDADGGNYFLSVVDSVNGDPEDIQLLNSILPPLPYRFKVTNGDIRTNQSYEQTFLGDASPSESVNFALHWGLMSTRVLDINNANKSTEFNELLSNYTKFFGVDQTVITSGSLSDSHNNNKFSLAKVALKGSTVVGVTGTTNDVFKSAVYIRNADASNSDVYDASAHLIKMDGTNNDIDAGADRVSLAKLLAEDTLKFNKYSVMAKFTAPMGGGFDGLNIFDRDSYFMTDRAASVYTAGTLDGKGADDGFASGIRGTLSSEVNPVMQGSEDLNNVIASYKNAIRIMTDDLVVNHNVLAIPNIRDRFVTDLVKDRIEEEYGKAIYLMDLEQYNKLGERVFVDARGIESSKPDVVLTAGDFDTREVDSSYVASYFPDVKVLDSGDSDEAAVNSRRSVLVPSSIVALGALALTDSISQPWFAPAGFSRGALESISSISVRLNAEDRDTLYESRINPIANFPNKQFVIFGQKTTQLKRTALDRVNVRRLVLEIKRRIELIAQGLLFEQNNSKTRNRFISSASSQLANIQINQGIEDFRVIMDDTNNTAQDVDNNRLNGQIVIVPTRAIEFIAIDFVITNSGVEFP